MAECLCSIPNTEKQQENQNKNLCFILLLFIFGSGSHVAQVNPQACYIAEDDCISESPASTSPVQGLHAHATTMGIFQAEGWMRDSMHAKQFLYQVSNIPASGLNILE